MIKFQKISLLKQFCSWQSIILALIVIGSGFLMIYKIDQTLVVGFDQGNHLNPVADFIRNHNIIYQGPAALEKGDYKAYLGPFYYYLLAIPLFITNLNVFSASYFSAIFALGSVVYIYYLTNKIFNSPTKSLITAFLLAFTYKFTAMGRGFTNPFFMMLFLLMLIDSVWTICKGKNVSWRWWAMFGFSLSASLQIHSSSFLLILPVFAYLFYKKIHQKIFKGWLIAIGVFLFLYSPYIVYQATHNLYDIRQYYGALKAKDPNSVEKLNIVSSIQRVVKSLDISVNSFSRWGEKEGNIGITIAWVITFLSVIIFAIIRKNKIKEWYLFSTLWVVMFLVSASFFRFPLWDYYFIAIYPILFMALADILGFLIFKTKILGVIVLVLAGGYYVYSNSLPILKEIDLGEYRATHNPVQPSDLLYVDLKSATDYIVSDSNGQPVQINFCYKFFYPGCFSYQPAYDFLLRYNKKLNWQDRADTVYFVRNPKDIESCGADKGDMKLISKKDFISVGVDKYEIIKK